MHDGDEAIGRRLGADVLPREVAPQQVTDEARLAHGILPNEKHHWLGVKVAIIHDRRVEFAKFVGLRVCKGAWRAKGKGFRAMPCKRFA